MAGSSASQIRRRLEAEMGVEFRLGQSDHKVVDDFLAGQPEGVTGIWVEPHHVRIQKGVIETAKAIGLQVLVEPFTERLTVPGFMPKGLDYAAEGPLDLEGLLAGHGRGDLVRTVVDRQVEAATTFVPPHFFAHNDETAELNVDLAGRALAAYNQPLRAVLVASREYLANGHTAKRIAASYSGVGVESVDLRLSPLGGEDESVRKVHSALEVVRIFRDAGLEVHFGYQGHVGQTALALGLLKGFSVGVGMREQVNHAAAIGRQTHTRDDHGAGVSRGPLAGSTWPRRQQPFPAPPPGGSSRIGRSGPGSHVHLGAVPAVSTAPSSTSEATTSMQGHRASRTLLSRPVAWRSAQEFERLSRALELRQILNDHHLPDGAHQLKTRTLRSLLAEMDFRREALSA